MFQLGDSRFVVPILAGVVPQWYSLPLSIPASIMRVNYATLGLTGGNVNSAMNIYIAPLGSNLRTEAPTLVLAWTLTAATRTSRVALGQDLLFYGGDYALIIEHIYVAPPATPLFGPCAAISAEAPLRLMSWNAGAFNAAQGVNFDGTAPAGYNNAAVFTDAALFPYNLPWLELYYCGLAAGEPVPGGETGGGVPPVARVDLSPCKVGVTP
jgi:hypothetical protein